MSLKSRRKLLLHNAQGGGSDEPEMISVLKVDTSIIPFPYDDEYKYAYQIGNPPNFRIGSSPSPVYIYKATYRDYKLIAKAPADKTGKTMIPLENVDTSELGNGEYYISKYGQDYGNIGVCNYPVQEVRFSDGGTKLIVVRE